MGKTQTQNAVAELDSAMTTVELDSTELTTVTLSDGQNAPTLSEYLTESDVAELFGQTERVGFQLANAGDSPQFAMAVIRSIAFYDAMRTYLSKDANPLYVSVTTPMRDTLLALTTSGEASSLDAIRTVLKFVAPYCPIPGDAVVWTPRLGKFYGASIRKVIDGSNLERVSTNVRKLAVLPALPVVATVPANLNLAILAFVVYGGDKERDFPSLRLAIKAAENPATFAVLRERFELALAAAQGEIE